EHGMKFIRDIPETGLIETTEGMKPYGGKVHYPKTRVITLTTAKGFKLTVTPNHLMPTPSGEMVPAENLGLGDLLNIKSNWSNTGEKPVIPGPPAHDVRAKTYLLPKSLTEEFAEFLGIMVADGTLYRSGFRLAKRYKDVADRFDF